MIKLNLQFFGGRESAAGKRSGESNTTSRETTNINPTQLDKATFTKQLTGVYTAKAGTIERSWTEGKADAVEMSIVPGRENGKNFYQTRYLLRFQQNADWQYGKRYTSLNAAKKGVKSEVKEELDSLMDNRRRR